MSNTSLDISKTIDPLQRDLLTRVFAVARTIRVPLIVTGAAARDLILTCGYGIRVARMTTDVDVGVEDAKTNIYWPSSGAVMSMLARNFNGNVRAARCNAKSSCHTVWTQLGPNSALARERQCRLCRHLGAA